MSEPKITRRKLADFMPAAVNPNKGSEHSVPLIVSSITMNGAGRPMLADRDGEMIAGSHSLQAFVDAGFEDAWVIESDGQRPVIFVREDVDIDTPQGRSLQLGDNQIGQKSFVQDDELVAALLANLAAEDERLVKAAGYDEWDVQALLESVGNGHKAEDAGAAEDTVSRADELQQEWDVQSSADEPEMWIIRSMHGGEHRLLCGDSTNPEHVAHLMDDDCAELVWTDPPYGVAVGDKNKFLNAIARSNRVEENLQNDTLDEPALFEMLNKSFDNAIRHCKAGGAWYVAAPPGPLHVLFGLALKERGIWRQTIQWVKNNATFSPMGVDYHWQAEPIFYGWLPGAGHRYYGGRQQTTVWEIDRPMASPEHPTMKPVELVLRAINNSTQRGEIAYDPFCGSGTTLVACEQSGRQGRAIELEPKYCAVTLQRLADMGLHPERL